MHYVSIICQEWVFFKINIFLSGKSVVCVETELKWELKLTHLIHKFLTVPGSISNKLNKLFLLCTIS